MDKQFSIWIHFSIGFTVKNTCMEKCYKTNRLGVFQYFSIKNEKSNEDEFKIDSTTNKRKKFSVILMKILLLVSIQN